MDTEHLRLDAAQLQHTTDNLDEVELSELLSDEETDSSGPKYERYSPINR